MVAAASKRSPASTGSVEATDALSAVTHRGCPPARPPAGNTNSTDALIRADVTCHAPLALAHDSGRRGRHGADVNTKAAITTAHFFLTGYLKARSLAKTPNTGISERIIRSNWVGNLRHVHVVVNEA